MNLDKLTVNIKPLSAYQAMDLGLAVARAWYGELWRLWWLSGRKRVMVMVGVWAFGIYWQLKHDQAIMIVLGMMIFWWLKPRFEKPLMVYLSQRLFDDRYQIHQVAKTLATLPNSLRVPSRFRRRMVGMPVCYLEGLSGKSATARIKMLSRRQEDAIFVHQVMFFMAEMVLLMASMTTLRWLFSASSHFGVVGSFNDTLAVVLQFVLYVLIVSVLAPFFVASGFMMYLCKRSLLEGWDIELIFRQLSHRHERLYRHKGGAS